MQSVKPSSKLLSRTTQDQWKNRWIRENLPVAPIAKIFTSNEIQKTSNQISFSTRGEKQKQYLKKSVAKNILSKHNFTANSEKTEEELIERSLEKKDETWSN